jgi:pimeloyl-ACP methyl ester carboxylesterase
MNTVPEDHSGQSSASPGSAAPASDAQPGMPTLLFIHGACVRDADWWWSRMVQPLTERGISTATVALPSCGETGNALGDLADDVQACRQAIREVRGPVVLCGHSYGGVIITEAGADERVTQLLYVTSVMPDAGQSQAELIGGEPAPWLQAGEDTIGVDADMMPEYFMQDCDKATVEAAVARLTRQSLAPFSEPPREIAWRSTPASYIVCTQDLATPAETQRGRIRAGARHVEFDGGHHPFLSRPDAFAQLLVDEIRVSMKTAS